MTTGVAVPLILGFRMAGFRRGPPDNLPQASNVRRNLFGPIDHEENLKFVQDELNKISKADCKRWNFDFQAEKPKEGRYSWEPVSEKVPQAYEMQAMCSHHTLQQQTTPTPTQTPTQTQTQQHPYLTNTTTTATTTATTTTVRTPTTDTTERRNTPTPPSVSTTTTTTTTTTTKAATKRKAEDDGDGGGGGDKRLKKDITTLRQKSISAYMKITKRPKEREIKTTTATATTATTATATTTTTAATTTSTPDS